MNNTIHIRLATSNDITSILEIYNDAIVNTTAVYAYEPYTIDMMKKWYDEKLGGGYPICVALSHNTIVGFSALGKFRLKPAYQYAVEHSVFVHPDHFKKGIGSILLNDIIERAKKMQKHVIIGGIDFENKASIKLHKKHGFIIAGTIKQVGFKFDRWLDLCFMQLILD